MKMKVNAHAKINLCLNVIGKRNDGYHELEMVMVPLALHDTITIGLAQEDRYTSNDKYLCMDATNTIVKAVHLMRSHFAFQNHFSIHVDKHIPAQAGLAGGSADGAAVMRGIRDYLHLPISIEELAQLGKQIGADVPFCVLQTCAVVKGIGEQIEPFSMHCDFEILLVKPSTGVSTKQAFSMLDFEACEHPDSAAVKACLVHNDFEGLSTTISNSLEYSAFQLVPHIMEIKEELKAMGLPAVLMSGSGSTVFALTRNKILLHQTADIMRKKGYFVCETKIL